MTVTVKKRGDAIKYLADLSSSKLWNLEVRAGILNGTEPHEGSDLSIGEVAAIHEFGAPSVDIVARSFIQTGVNSAKRKGLAEVAAKAIRKATRKMISRPAALKIIGDFLAVNMRSMFLTNGDGTWLPLAESTVKKKGHALILRDTDQLIRAIDAKVVRTKAAP